MKSSARAHTPTAAGGESPGVGGIPLPRRGRSLCARARALRECGMTLIEILVVLTLIGVVLGLVGSNYLGKSEQAKVKATTIEIEQIGQALDLFKLEVGRYPTTQEGLQALVAAPAGVANWAGPYWKKNTAPKDPWGHDYVYQSPGTHGDYDLMSYGADGKEGGEGVNKDITSWDASSQ